MTDTRSSAQGSASSTTRRPTWSSASQPKSGGPSRARLLLPVIVGGALIGGGIMMLKSEEPTQTMSEVTRQLQDVALRRSKKVGLDDGGSVGPWWIAATEVDPLTGNFIEFRLRSGTRLVTAANARLILDPVADTFAFQLSDAVFTRLPDEFEVSDPKSHLLHSIDQYMLGPAPWGRDIVADETLAPGPPPNLDDLLNPQFADTPSIAQTPD